MGISPRRLAGWEPATITFYERDWLGRKRSAVTVREPEFSEWDRQRLMEVRRRANAPRGSHGRLMSEATDPANQYRFRVGLPITDHAQAALNKAQEAYRKRWGDDADMDSLLWEVELGD